jgi:hypothetical protein
MRFSNVNVGMAENTINALYKENWERMIRNHDSEGEIQLPVLAPEYVKLKFQCVEVEFCIL